MILIYGESINLHLRDHLFRLLCEQRDRVFIHLEVIALGIVVCGVEGDRILLFLCQGVAYRKCIMNLFLLIDRGGITVAGSERAYYYAQQDEYVSCSYQILYSLHFVLYTLLMTFI